jgi:arginase
MKLIEFIGVASGWGAKVRDSEKGAETLKATGFYKKHKNMVWERMIYPKFSSTEKSLSIGMETKPVLNEIFANISKQVKEIISKDHFPVIIGGDHSNAIGTWSGIIKAHNAAGDFGLIWIDAHMDSHTYETSPSKAFHGMPLAALLGQGEPEFINLEDVTPKLNPKHVVLMGIRSFEEGEQKLLEKLNVRIMYMDEIKNRGFDKCFDEALQIVKTNTKKFGISLDLDFFDPEFAPATPSLESNGEDPKHVLPSFKKLSVEEKFAGFEIVEFNPKTDKNNITLKLIEDVIDSIFN